MTYTATYSPEDNKIRLSASSRLSAEDYARVKAAGFKWAPKQEVFIAPMWTPEREDLALEFAGEIEDEDSTLMDRAEQRAERFEDYSDKRAADAESARKHVASIADGIPLGQPILVGHHSEKHARRDSEKIENGMRRAVKMWETSKYWTDRAAATVRHAKYKELPAVRARRIKGLEADLRRVLKNKTDSEAFSKMWEPITNEDWDRARSIANYDHACSGSCFPLADYPRLTSEASKYEGAMGLWSALEGIITPEQARDMAMRAHRRVIASCDRWINHLSNRLEYEHAMLAEGGGLVADKFNFAVGGRVLRRGKWFVVTGLNRRDGQLLSVSIMGHWCGTIPVEEINDYREPVEGDAEKVKAVTKLAPLANWPGEGFRHVSKTDFKKTYGVWIHTFPATETHGAYRSYSKFKGGGGLDCHDRIGIYITDQKRKDPPTLTVKPEPITFERPLDTIREQPVYVAPAPVATDAEFEAMQASLKAGIKTVSAPQLFPTPSELAARMVEIANIQPGQTVLEPSAGTGAIVRAIIDTVDTEIVGYEINSSLVSSLDRTFPGYRLKTYCRDFLEVTEGQGQFPVVLMNPPFVDGQDVEHVQHAYRFLNPGGILVSVMCSGPFFRSDRKSTAFRTWIDEIGAEVEDLPADTFKTSGTGVSAKLVVIRRPDNTPDAPPIAGVCDTEWETRLQAERVSLELQQKSTRRVDAGRKSIEDSPLFGGERQGGLFS